MGAAVGLESFLPTQGAQQKKEKEENRPVSSSHLTLIVRMMAASGWKERRQWAEQRGEAYEVFGACAELVGKYNEARSLA